MRLSSMISAPFAPASFAWSLFTFDFFCQGSAVYEQDAPCLFSMVSVTTRFHCIISAHHA